MIVNKSRRATLLLPLLCLVLAACGPAPDYRDSHGNSGRFADFRGQWLVINYWATWCKPCIEEIPELNELAATYPDTLALFGVDFDKQQGEPLRQAIAKLGIAFPVLLEDPSGTLAFDYPQVLPTTYLIDPEGKLHKTLKGPQTLASLRRAMSLQAPPDDD